MLVDALRADPRIVRRAMLRVAAMLAVCCAATVFAQHAPIEADGERARAEILRRGDMVEAVGAGPRAASSELFAQAMEPPTDDNQKWFVSVITMRNCPACIRLERDFARSEYLRAIGNPTEPKLSWSHLNFYDKDDASQMFRWRNIRFKGYPTTIVQPPRTGRFGEAGTVIDQITGYDGDPKKLAMRISASVKLYVKRLSEIQPRTGALQKQPYSLAPAKRAHPLLAMQPVSVTRDMGQVGVDPPWQPRPKNDPAVPPDVTPLPDLNVPVFPFDQPPPDAKPDAKPEPSKDNALPEAILVVDSENPQPAVEAQARRFLDRLRAERKPLVVRIVDYALAKNLPTPVKRDETPTVVVQDGDRVEKISGRLLPLLAQPPPEPKAVTIADLPWDSILSLLSGGFSIGAIIPLAIWGIRFLRARRLAAGKQPLIDQANFDGLLQLAQQIDFAKLLEQFRKPEPPKQ